VPRFRVGNENWEFCSGADCQDCQPIRQLLDYESALSWLRRFKHELRAMTDLRYLLYSLDLDPVDRLDDDQVLARIASALDRGRLRVCDREATGGTAGSQAAGRTGAKEKTQEEELVVAPQVRKTWVEFAVIDMEGKPVSNRKYVVMLPDGSLHEGMLDRTGVVRFNNIDPENSVFSLPDLDRDAWDRVG
jgi:hypothetical protein